MALNFSSDNKPATGTYKNKKAPDLRAQVDGLEDRLNRMTLTMTAMWEVLTRETQHSEEELMEKINDLDVEDGLLDGKLAPEIRLCQNCQKPMKLRQTRCGYCETFSPIEKPFDALW